MLKRVIIDVNDEASFAVKESVDSIVLIKNTRVRLTVDNLKYSAPKKSDIIIANISLKDSKTVDRVIVYESIYKKEIQHAFDEIVRINNLGVLDGVELTNSSVKQPRSFLGDGSYKAPQIFNEKEYE